MADARKAAAAYNAAKAGGAQPPKGAAPEAPAPGAETDANKAAETIAPVAKPQPGPTAIATDEAKAAQTISPAPGTAAGPVKKTTDVAVSGLTGFEVKKGTEQEQTVGGVASRQASGATATVGGDDVAAVGGFWTRGQSVAGSDRIRPRPRRGGLSNTGTVYATVGQQRQQVIGTDNKGQPITTSTAVHGGATLGPRDSA